MRQNKLVHGLLGLLAVFHFSAAWASESEPYPRGPLLQGPIHFVYAIYYTEQPVSQPVAALNEAIKDAGGPSQLTEKLPPDAGAAFVAATLDSHIAEDYPPPSLTMIGNFGRGVTREQALALQKSTSALVLEFAHPASMSTAALRAADKVLLLTAEKTGGFLWDEETREIFTPAEWRRRRLDTWQADIPDVRAHTVIHAYKDDKLVRAVTLGMAKFGLPDIVVNDFSWSNDKPVGNLINIFAQASIEGASLTESGAMDLDLRSVRHQAFKKAVVDSSLPNATALARLALFKGRWEEGDPHNRLIEIGFGRYAGVDNSARQSAMLDTLFGSSDGVVRVKHTDPILAASQAAKAKLPALREEFNRGLQPGQYFMLKAPFSTPTGGREWMWVEVLAWKGTAVQGLLRNEPSYVPTLHAGQTVNISQDEVFDYIRVDGKGIREGNETGKLMLEQSAHK